MCYLTVEMQKTSSFFKNQNQIQNSIQTSTKLAMIFHKNVICIFFVLVCNTILICSLAKLSLRTKMYSDFNKDTVALPLQVIGDQTSKVA